MIKIEVCGNTTKEAVNELIELAELIKGNVKFSKPLVTTREDVVKEDNMSNLTPTPVVKEVEDRGLISGLLKFFIRNGLPIHISDGSSAAL